MQIEAKFTSGLGRKIEHVKHSEEESDQNFLKACLPDHYTKLLSSIEAMSANGVEDRMTNTVEEVTERPPFKPLSLGMKDQLVSRKAFSSGTTRLERALSKCIC